MVHAEENEATKALRGILVPIPPHPPLPLFLLPLPLVSSFRPPLLSDATQLTRTFPSSRKRIYFPSSSRTACPPTLPIVAVRCPAFGDAGAGADAATGAAMGAEGAEEEEGATETGVGVEAIRRSRASRASCLKYVAIEMSTSIKRKGKEKQRKRK